MCCIAGVCWCWQVWCHLCNQWWSSFLTDVVFKTDAWLLLLIQNFYYVTHTRIMCIILLTIYFLGLREAGKRKKMVYNEKLYRKKWWSLTFFNIFYIKNIAKVLRITVDASWCAALLEYVDADYCIVPLCLIDGYPFLVLIVFNLITVIDKKTEGDYYF